MNISMPRGDQHTYSFRIKNTNTGAFINSKDELDKLFITFREKPLKTSPILFQKTLDDIEIDSETHKVKFQILKEDTESLDYGTYGYDIEITIGNLIKTKTGLLTLTDEYTMEE